jgi:hypothetical protein
MDTVRAELLPYEANGVKPDEIRSILHVLQESLDDVVKHIGIMIVEVHLIVAKSCPDIFRATRCFKRSQKRMSSGTRYERNINVCIESRVVLRVLRVTSKELFEPFVRSRRMIENTIEHDMKFPA